MVTSRDSAGDAVFGLGSRRRCAVRERMRLCDSRRGRLRGSWVRAARFITVLLVAVSVFAIPASAQAETQYASDTVVVADGDIVPLASVTIEANAGDKFYVTSRLQTKAARQNRTHHMLVALMLGCDGGVDLLTTQNIDYGKNVLRHTGRYIFEAPQDGVFECRLRARGLVHGQQSNPPARYTVDGANTYISVSGRQPSWVKQQYQGSKRLIRTGRAEDVLLMSFKAPDDVSSFSATADVEMTDCYNGGYLCDTVPSNRMSSVVETRLLVMQRRVDGGYCKVTRWPESGLKRTTITWEQHHKKSYHRVTGVPVSDAADCTRDFRIKVYTRVRSGNDLMIESKPYTNAFVKK